MFEHIRQFDRTVHNFLAATFFMGLSNGMFDAVYNFYLEARNITKLETGYIYSIAMTMMAASVIPMVLLSHKFQKRRLLIVASLLYSLPFFVLPVLTSTVLNSLALGLMSSGMIAMLSLGHAIAGASVSYEKKTFLFSAFFVMYLGAAMFGSLVASVITHYSVLADLVNYQIIIYMAFFSSVVMIFFRIRSSNGINRLVDKEKAAMKDKNIEWSNFIALFISSALLGASITLVFRFINLIFNLAYSINVSEISLIMGIDKLASIAGAVFAPLLISRISLKPAIIVAGFLTFICIYVQSLHISLFVFILLYLFRLILNYSLMPLLDTLAITAFSESRTLLSVSVRQLSFYLGSAISSVAYGILLDNNQWEISLIVSAVLALTGACFMSAIRVKNMTHIIKDI